MEIGKHATIDVAIREPAGFEFDRVRYLFGNSPLMPEARFFAATRSRPVERFIAAVAWWPVGTVGHFQIACQPGVARCAAAASLIARVEVDARRTGMKSIQYANLVTEENDWFGILETEGFGCLHSERAFEISYRDAWLRVMRLHQKHRSRIPSAWRTVSIREHSPEITIKLLAPHCLVPPDEVRHYWQTNCNQGFDPELSCLLFNGSEPFGIFLMRRMGGGLYIDAQVVHETNPLLRSLADFFMLYHLAQRVASDGPFGWIRFRGGQTEHRQTANLARRMGGREIARAHLMSKMV